MESGIRGAGHVDRKATLVGITGRGIIGIFFFRYHHIVSYCQLSGPTSKRPASDGGLYSGQLLIM